MLCMRVMCVEMSCDEGGLGRRPRWRVRREPAGGAEVAVIKQNEHKNK